MVELTWMTKVTLGEMTNQADKGREAEIDRACRACKDINELKLPKFKFSLPSALSEGWPGCGTETC